MRWILILLFPVTLYAFEWNQDVFILENNPPPNYPFSVSATYLDINPSSVRTSEAEGDRLKFREWDTTFVYTHPLNSYNGLIFGASWIGTELEIEQNFDFNETRFNYINFSLGGYTQAFHDWTWTISLAAYIDLAGISLFDYTLYQGALWGRYDLCDRFELDFGFIIQTGLKKDRVWPLVGFIYLPSDRWRLSVVYPVDISLSFDICPNLTAAAQIRFLQSRHRVAEDEPNPQAIFEYRTRGVEFDLDYAPSCWLGFRGFAGSTVSGTLEISDSNNHDTNKFKFKDSFYAGVSALISY